MLFCFDVDGTLDCKENDNEEYLKGIIPEQKLIDLSHQGHIIAIVSPSPYFPSMWKDKNWFCRNGDGFNRWENIKDAMEFYNIEDKNKVVYVDDLKGVLKLVKKFGIEQVYTPEEFMEKFSD